MARRRSLSPSLYKADAGRLRKFTERMKDESLSPAQRREARRKRSILMLSLWRAGWRYTPIAEAAGATLSVVREQIVVQSASTKSVKVYNPRGDRVVPEPRPEEFDYGTLKDEEVERLQLLSAMANNANFSHSETSPEYRASRTLDFLLAYLYDKGRRPTDMARALRSSNSMVRLRIRRAKKDGDMSVAGNYVYPAVIEEEVQRIKQTL